MAVATLIPYDERGREIIGELGENHRTPIEVQHYGPREYYVRAENVRLAGLDAVLDRIDRDWRDHLGLAS